MIFCARATRGLEGPRWTRAVEDQSAPILREITSKRGGTMCIVRCAQLRAALATPQKKMEREEGPRREQVDEKPERT